jgi:hypothetical protein
MDRVNEFDARAASALSMTGWRGIALIVDACTAVGAIRRASAGNERFDDVRPNCFINDAQSEWRREN